MRGILLYLMHVFSSTGAPEQNAPAASPQPVDWLNSHKHQLFLNAAEVCFFAEGICIGEGNSEIRIAWKDLEFFHYPFVGLNIKIPGSRATYFSLILKKEKESGPLLNQFISRLSGRCENQLGPGREDTLR